MSYLGAPANPAVDTGLSCLHLIAALFNVRIELEAIKREYLPSSQIASVDDLLRIAKGHGFKSKVMRVAASSLSRIPLPAIGESTSDGFFIIARASETAALIAGPGERPREVSHDELMKLWSGRIILITKREHLPEDIGHFGLRWFLPVVTRFRSLLSEVLVVSFFLGVIGLVTPIFFQVIIDKVLVHRAFTTLEVILTALVVVNIAEAGLTWLRTYAFSHATSRIDALLGAKLFTHLISLPIAYFETRATGQTMARVRELESVVTFREAPM